MDINSQGVNCDTHSSSRGKVVPKFTDESQIVTYGDILIGKIRHTNKGYRVKISIIDGSIFE